VPQHRDKNPQPAAGTIEADPTEVHVHDDVGEPSGARRGAPRWAPPVEDARSIDTDRTDLAVALPARGRPVEIGDWLADRYLLVERLGTGAMGEVYVAEHATIGVKVAVKLLKPHMLADPVFRERFLHEAQAIAAVSHPNVARFLDLVVGDPTFLVMEYARGPTLAERLHKEGKLAPKHAGAIAIRLSWALAAVHAAGIIHRDLKPSNVILAPDLEHGQTPKLIDFGLAKLAARSETPALTRTGHVVGTPNYMSPEQISGKPVDARADIYALGCLLWELVAGRPPFYREDELEVLYAQVHQPPPPLLQHVPEAPRALEKVLAKALAKDPDERYQTMPELASALEAAVGRAARTSGLYDDSIAGTMPHLQLPKAPRPSLARHAVWIAPLVLAAGLGGYALSRRAAQSGASLLLISEPPGATIELDGKPLGRATPTWAAGLAAGAHAVRFVRPGLAGVSRSITVAAGETGVVDVTLPAAVRRLEVRSIPDGAAVLLDGRLVLGETPTTCDVTESDFHELRVEKTGYFAAVVALTPDDHAPSLTLTLKPDPRPIGAVVVEANVAAEVWIDGADSGFTTPTLGIQVPVGRHLVELRDGTGARGASTVVTIERGQTVRLYLEPPRPTPP
jgi:serine/threonine-protein kinase